MISRKKKVALAFGGFALAYLAAAAGTQVCLRSFFLPEIAVPSTVLHRLEPRLLADLKRLSQNPVYPVLPREKNAERFLLGFVSWDGTPALSNVEHDRLMELMAAHQDALRSDEEWAAFLDDENLYDLDLAWVDQLTAYDHFDFRTHPAYAAALARAETSHGLARFEIAYSLPAPRLKELRFAALARAAQLIRERRLEDAQALYRHVGYLLSTTDSLVGSAMAVVMLQNEKRLAARTRTAWPVIDDDRVEALRRVSWAWTGITTALAADGTLGVYAPYFQRSTSACTGVFDHLGTESLLQDYLKPTVFSSPTSRSGSKTKSLSRVIFSTSAGIPSGTRF
jgi:hypothetical protein